MSEYPTIPKSYKLYEEYMLPINIIRHSEQASKVAVFLAKKIIDTGEKIDVDLVRAAALLHDIAKPIDFRSFERDPAHTDKEFTDKQIKKWKAMKILYKGLTHEEAAEIIFQDYPKLAKIVKKHKYQDINEGLDSWEEKLIYYADKIVMNDIIETLEKRLKDGHRRYVGEPPYPKDVIETDKKIFELEEELLKKAGVSQKDIIGLNNVCIDKVLR